MVSIAREQLAVRRTHVPGEVSQTGQDDRIQTEGVSKKFPLRHQGLRRAELVFQRLELDLEARALQSTFNFSSGVLQKQKAMWKEHLSHRHRVLDGRARINFEKPTRVAERLR